MISKDLNTPNWSSLTDSAITHHTIRSHPLIIIIIIMIMIIIILKMIVVMIIMMMMMMMMMMMESYNARHIYSIGYTRCRCGATAELIRQSQTHPHKEEPEIQNRIYGKGSNF